MAYLRNEQGAVWGFLKKVIADALSNHVHDVDQLAYELVRPTPDEIFGIQDEDRETYLRPSANGVATYV